VSRLARLSEWVDRTFPNEIDNAIVRLVLFGSWMIPLMIIAVIAAAMAMLCLWPLMSEDQRRYFWED
jgi:hypothetical protein